MFTVVGYGLYLFCFAACRERIHYGRPPVTLRATGRTVASNRPLLILCLSNLAFFIGAGGFVILGAWVFVMPTSMPALVVTCLLLGFFQSMTMSLLFAFEADTVEYGQHLTGERTEGVTYAVYSFFRKVSQALAGAFVAYALSLGGFPHRRSPRANRRCAQRGRVTATRPRSSVQWCA